MLTILQQLQPLQVGATDGEVRLVFLEPKSGPTKVLTVRGQIEGPHCAWARTLPTQFRIEPIPHPNVLIVDPCYWTPAQPFLYRLELHVDFADGTSSTALQNIGLRRWATDGASLRLEHNRIVLRGAVTGDAERELPAARHHELALIVRNPSHSYCEEASRRGVALVADLRGIGDELVKTLRMLAWHPSVLVVLVDSHVPAVLDGVAPTVAAHMISSAGSSPAVANPRWNSVIAVELGSKERPPEWLASCGKPVIVIRRNEAYAELGKVRSMCDQLQADLAPEFDLAGYFVAHK